MSPIKHLQDAEPFNRLPEALVREIRAGARRKRYPADTFILRQDDPPSGYLYVIKEGLVEITVLVPDGGEMVVDYRQEGAFFGGTPIFTGEAYTGGVRTLKPTECYLIPGEILKRAERSYPQLGEYFSRVVHSRIRRLYSEIVAEHTRKALTRMEAYPFRKRLSEIMAAPVETCSPNDTARQVARRLAEKKIGSVIVVDEKNKPSGIITEGDLVARVLASEGANGSEVSAGEIMTPLAHVMSPDAYMFEAMACMATHRLKHLPVVDRGELIGIVALRDLMRSRGQKATLLVGNIREENTLEGLASIRRETVAVARTLLSETRSTFEAMEILSYIHHGIIRRTFELCLHEMTSNGRKMPKVRYCFLIMGSGGRREMLLGPDQDNGLIFEDVADERMPEIEAFFAPFSEKLVAALQQVGYPLCSGKVMADNPAWRGSLKDWKARLADWINEPEPLKVRYSWIVFDVAPLAGDPALARDLRGIVDGLIRNYQGCLYHMMSLDLRYKVPVGLLGRFVLDKSGEHAGELSLKQGGSVYIVDCIRMFALEKGLNQITTLERLKALVERHVFAAGTAEHIRAAFEALTFLRLRNEIALVEQGKEPSPYLAPGTLSKNEQDMLRESFDAVSKLQDAARRHFSRTPI